MKKRITAALGFVAPAAAFAEGETPAVTIPGLSDAITQAQTTATAMAGQVVPAAIVILLSFAGLLGVFLVWRVLRRGAGGR